MAYMERRGKNGGNPNPYIAKAYAEDAKKQHDLSIKRVKAAVDNTDPYLNAPHRKSNPKKESQMEARYAAIEHDNLLLLRRMHGILSEQGRFASLTRYGPRSLNINNRRKELERIAQENQLILQGLRNVKPNFSSAELRQNAVQQEKYVLQMSQYARGHRGDPAKFQMIRPSTWGGSRGGGGGGYGGFFAYGGGPPGQALSSTTSVPSPYPLSSSVTGVPTGMPPGGVYVYPQPNGLGMGMGGGGGMGQYTYPLTPVGMPMVPVPPGMFGVQGSVGMGAGSGRPPSQGSYGLLGLGATQQQPAPTPLSTSSSVAFSSASLVSAPPSGGPGPVAISAVHAPASAPGGPGPPPAPLSAASSATQVPAAKAAPPALPAPVPVPAPVPAPAPAPPVAEGSGEAVAVEAQVSRSSSSKEGSTSRPTSARARPESARLRPGSARPESAKGGARPESARRGASSSSSSSSAGGGAGGESAGPVPHGGGEETQHEREHEEATPLQDGGGADSTPAPPSSPPSSGDGDNSGGVGDGMPSTIVEETASLTGTLNAPPLSPGAATEGGGLPVSPFSGGMGVVEGGGSYPDGAAVFALVPEAGEEEGGVQPAATLIVGGGDSVPGVDEYDSFIKEDPAGDDAESIGPDHHEPHVSAQTGGGGEEGAGDMPLAGEVDVLETESDALAGGASQEAEAY